MLIAIRLLCEPQHLNTAIAATVHGTIQAIGMQMLRGRRQNVIKGERFMARPQACDTEEL